MSCIKIETHQATRYHFAAREKSVNCVTYHNISNKSEVVIHSQKVGFDSTKMPPRYYLRHQILVEEEDATHEFKVHCN